MKKFVCLLLIAALALGLCGCSFSFSFSSSARYEKANQYSVGSFTYDPAQIDAVEIHWQSGNLYLREAAGNALAVTEKDEGYSEDQQMRWLLDGRTLKIQFCKSGYSGSFTGEKRLDVEIPANIDLSVEQSSGDLSMGEHTLKALKAAHTSGNMRIGNSHADTLQIAATSGNLDAGLLDVKGDFDLAATSGNSTVEAVKAQRVKAAATSGNISLGLYQCGGVEIACTSGNVRLVIPRENGAAIDFATSSGDLNGRDVEHKKATLTVGDGACPVKVATTSGNLTVEEK